MIGFWKEESEKEQVVGEAQRVEGVLSPFGPIRRPKERGQRVDSLIAAGLTIEGKIQGTGNVRIAGCFKGDVRVEGDLTIEPDAQITGELRAHTVLVGGKVQGNVHATSRVELLESGILIGDLKAASLTVAAGSRMRGKVEFGWDEHEAVPVETREEGESS